MSADDEPRPPGGGATVCVTGAAGYLGSFICEALLGAGYRVRGTVRDAADPAKTDHLRAMGEIDLYSADLTRPGSFDDAFDGCAFVIHAASAVFLRAKDPQKEIVDVAVDGTRNVLESARKARVRRLVQTSSIAAIVDGRVDPRRHVFTEADWNESSTVDDGPYDLSKVQAERLARRVVDELPGDQKLELVALHPGLVLGPVKAKVHLRSSPSVIRRMMRGDFPMVPRLAFAVVDVRDVALAHVRALEVDDPAPRYLLVAGGRWMKEVVETLRPAFPEAKLPRFTAPDPLVYALSLFDPQLSVAFLRRNLGVQRRFDRSRAERELGIAFRAPEASILDTARSARERGWV